MPRGKKTTKPSPSITATESTAPTIVDDTQENTIIENLQTTPTNKSTTDEYNVHDSDLLTQQYLKLRGFMSQHVISFNHFVDFEMKQICLSPNSNHIVQVSPNVDSKWFMRYLNIYVRPITPGYMPAVYGESRIATSGKKFDFTPHYCRLSDLTYCSDILVDIEYWLGDKKVRRNGVVIGYLPIMLRSKPCILSTESGEKHRNIPPGFGPDHCSEETNYLYKECPRDPGGYFVVKGTERVVLMQEQAAPNRIFLDEDPKSGIMALVVSSSSENKGRTVVCYGTRQTQQNVLFVKLSSFTELVPVVIVLKALGYVSDFEIAASCLGHNGSALLSDLLPSVDVASKLGIYTQKQAIEYLASKVQFRHYSSNKSNVAKSTDKLADILNGDIQTTSTDPDADFDIGKLPETHPDLFLVLHRVLLSHVNENTALFLKENQNSNGSGDSEIISFYSESTQSQNTPLSSEYIHKIFRAKAAYLCEMTMRILLCRRDPKLIDDKDYYGNKRIELAGNLISVLFEDLFKTRNSEIKKDMEKLLVAYHAKASKQNSSSIFTTGRGSSDFLSTEYPDVSQTLDSNKITQGLKYAISTGNWYIKRFRINRSGVTQVLSRLSYITVLGAVTRVKSCFEKSRKVAGPRALQTSQFGLLCPSDTPEGEQCGLVKHLSVFANISTNLSTEEQRNIIHCAVECGMTSISTLHVGLMSASRFYENQQDNFATVMLNGNIIGVVSDPQKFCKRLRTRRTQNTLSNPSTPVKLIDEMKTNHSSDLLFKSQVLPSFLTSIHFNETLKVVYISCDGGRLCRPLLLIRENHKLPRRSQFHESFNKLTLNGVIEWIDVNEANDTLIAMDYSDFMNRRDKLNFTHMEINPSTIYGLVASLVPYPHHNQSPRNTYQCAMGKQAMGVVAWNEFHRADTQLLGLVYSQLPLVRSKTLNLVGFQDIPAGHAASVAVMSFSGYDIEDAIVLNKGAVDRGYGRCFEIRKHQHEIESYGHGIYDRLSFDTLSNRSNFNGIDSDGLSHVGARIKPDDAYLVTYRPVDVSNDLYSERPRRYKHPLWSNVDRVILSRNEKQVYQVKTMLRQVRVPELGDKFSSRHGQKGVVGTIVPSTDFPFSDRDGWQPDMIMNPHGFPSRMTVGKLLECVAGKGAVVEGRSFADSTIFGGDSVERISKSLISMGFNPSGKDLLVSGITGELLPCYVFNGPIYYQKLKHMVVDKMHARSRGPVQNLTRQPTEGRGKDGGLRLGEMERDCLVAYGVSNLLIERLVTSSDGFILSVCNTCGFFVNKDSFCDYCQTGANVITTRLPYACKLLFQELIAMNIYPKLKLTPV